MPKSIDDLRRDATRLKKSHAAGDAQALVRVQAELARPGDVALKHADFLHVIAREQGFASWPALVEAAEVQGLDRASAVQRLKIALFHGQNHKVSELLQDWPDLPDDSFALQVALYRRAEVAAALACDPGLAVEAFGPRRPILHLAFSKWFQTDPNLEADMLAIAEMLVAHGADVNDSFPVSPENDHPLSALYGAIGHGNNMVLGRWLLERGANPNDGESLYHATELGHHEGLKLLLAHGADPRGTNALLRAMDFHDVVAVRMLLEAGALADEFNAEEVGGEAPWVMPTLHQAARRMSPPEMIEVLLDAGSDPSRMHQGLTPYAYARVFGNRDLARALETRGQAHVLSGQVSLMARIADGEDLWSEFLDPNRMPEGCRNIVRLILHLPGKLDHVRRLVAAGAEYDRPDHEGLTPVQAAGWEGLPEVLRYFLSLKPDLGHVNTYGGTLLSTILHGSENCPVRAERQYLACLELVLKEGVALPRQAISFAGDPEVSAFLKEWAARYPGQVVQG